MTAEEVAERLGVTEAWSWAHKGEISHVRLGRYRRFREEAIDQWLREFEGARPTP